MRKKFQTILIFTTLFFYSCNYTVVDYEKNDLLDGDTGIVIEGNSELFKNDEEHSDIFFFATNEKKYVTENGYTLWKYDPRFNSYKDFSVRLTKTSGDAGAGYGTVFCVSEIDGKSFMMCVLINSKGRFCVGYVEDGKFNYIVPWSQGTGILKGSGIGNVISISYNGEENRFKLQINGETNSVFGPSKQISFEDCKFGYVAVISSRENFPKVPVKVSFELI